MIVQADTVEGNGKLNQDVIFIYCKGNFSDNVQGEQWVKNWCHEECVGDEFTCE
jgi:hypothetical protein